jgi:queuine tRNA-ribosyltransferase
MALAPLPDHRYRYDIRRNSNREEPRPLVEGCPCLACTRFSRAYVHYLSRAEELSGVRLVTIHNLVYTGEIVRGARAAIRGGRLSAYGDALREGAAPWEAGSA